MSNNLQVNNFERREETSHFTEGFIKNYNEESGEGHFLEADVQYPQMLHKLHNDLLFLSERMKIGKVEKLVANLYYKTEYVTLIKFFKTNSKAQRVIKFNQKD